MNPLLRTITMPSATPICQVTGEPGKPRPSREIQLAIEVKDASGKSTRTAAFVAISVRLNGAPSDLVPVLSDAAYFDLVSRALATLPKS